MEAGNSAERASPLADIMVDEAVIPTHTAATPVPQSLRSSVDAAPNQAVILDHGNTYAVNYPPTPSFLPV